MKRNILAGLLLLSLLGCSEDGTVASGSPANAPIRFDAACNLEGLAPALRQTFVMIDEGLVQKISEPQEFASKNKLLRDLVTALADPSAIELGRMAARERITIYLAPAGGGSAKQVFSGCLPGISAEEKLALAGAQGGLNRFFAGNKEDEFLDSANQFTAAMVGTLIAIAQRRTDAAVDEQRLATALRSIGSALRGTEASRRVFIVSNSLDGGSHPSITDARRAGLKDGAESGLDLGNSDLYVLSEFSPDALGMAFAEARATTQSARLAGWSNDIAGFEFGTPPVRIVRYAGKALYPDGQSLVVRVRIGVDDAGRMVDSWLTLSDLRDMSIPMFGQAICQERGDCEYKSDRSGFAQAWVAERSSVPSFDNEAPFAGLREWSMRSSGAKLTGEVFDSAVSRIGGDPNRKSIPFEATIQQKSTH